MVVAKVRVDTSTTFHPYRINSSKDIFLGIVIHTVPNQLTTTHYVRRDSCDSHRVWVSYYLKYLKRFFSGINITLSINDSPHDRKLSHLKSTILLEGFSIESRFGFVKRFLVLDKGRQKKWMILATDIDDPLHGVNMHGRPTELLLCTLMTNKESTSACANYLAISSQKVFSWFIVYQRFYVRPTTPSVLPKYRQELDNMITTFSLSLSGTYSWKME
ncbi:hypothetical protein KIN20_016851 [Parelaphostrongylus tenuis]|uniref:Uncharacterized protein n=1 Tax=Parelaphostrongylus tenuis TaxID=148309 RepID=A0AAD5MH31_PARTN|nr:hypothetical protein KIN20_016851 [Parelaphostrongylus tenuis]